MLKRHLYIGLFVCTLMCLNVFPSLAFAAPYDGQNPTLATEESTGNDQTIVDATIDATGDAADGTVVDTTLPSTGKDDLSDDPGKNAETTDPSEVTSVTEPDSDDAATPTVPTQESAADSTETGKNSAADGSDDSIKPVDTDKEANMVSPAADEKTKEDSKAGSVSAVAPASEPEAAVAPLSQPKTSALLNGWVTNSSGTYFYDKGALHYGWLVRSDYKSFGLQRYFMDKATGRMRVSSLIKASEAGWWAYATRYGYIVRGRYTAPNGTVYYSNNDGKLANPGWMVSSAYGQGLQRYYIDKNAHGAVPGYSSAGWDHYTTPAGYVVRGRYKASNGTVYFANNDGRLAKTGWMVTSAYGQGLQRYWIDKKAHGAVPGYSEDGWAHYTLSAGYVLRGITTLGADIYLADNDGRIAKSGWVVMDAKNGYGLQRYWVSNHRVVKDRLIKASEAGWWAYATRYGYVVRGVYDTGRGLVYLANNDGKLASANGWLVTGAYTGGVFQRYYIDATTHAARSGFFTVAGYGDCFGLGGVGYVLRGKASWNNHVLLANNDGKLNTTKGWLVTGAYDGGTLQRYWMENCYSNHFKGARVSNFTVNGQTYYGLSGKGYVLRNGYLSKNYVLYKANNNGALSQYRATDKMRILLQNPELPAGCESVALTMVLRSLGFGLNKTTIADSYMPYSSWDFTHSFQGSPYSGGGILAPGLITTANNYLRSQGSSLSCKSLSNSSFSKLVSIANNGTPVLVWTTMYMGSPQYSGNYVGGYQWYYNEHCVVLCGSGNGGVRIFDSLSGEVWRDYGDFSRLYSSCGSMAAVIA